MSIARRIMVETMNLKREPIPGIKAVADKENTRLFHVKMEGPRDSPYEGGLFSLELFLPDGYPMQAPSARFATKIFHPNIDNYGRICLDILKHHWNPSLQIRTVLISIQAMLSKPNLNDPLQNEVTKIWRTNAQKAWEIARNWTTNYAQHA